MRAANVIFCFLCVALATKRPKPEDSLTGAVREYFIAAEEVVWDYLPSGRDIFRDLPVEESEPASEFCLSGEDRIGSKYKKALYYEYTDESFQTRVEKDVALGFLGPVIRAEVGDTIKITFKNNATRPYTMHPHGVLYDKNSEGAVYADGTNRTAEVLPGAQFIYYWPVPERSGPGPADASSILWMYHSHVHEPEDTYAGLVGPLVIYKAGMLSEEKYKEEFDREMFAYFTVTDENQSWYIEENVEEYCGDPESVDYDDDDFIESNLMHGINGLVFSNMNSYYMCQGEIVRWYVFALGNEIDLHTAHWHGQTLLVNGHRKDVVDLLPATMITADMTVDNPADGPFMFHCHVNDHIEGGMIAYFTVDPTENCQRKIQKESLQFKQVK